MPDTAVPPNLRLIGGEMLAWSDDDAASGRLPVRGRVLERLARTACPPDGRVLVAGPHDPDLVEALAGGGASVACLLRSYADSAALARRFPTVEVLCGSLAKLVPGEQFDAIVALDGVHRLVSVEGVNLNWGEALDTLLAALRPGGRLVLALENLLGVHRLVELAPWAADETDAAWTPAGEYDDSRPRSLAQLTARLTAAELRVGPAFSGYAVPGAPSLLVSAGGAGDAALDGWLDGLVAAACAAGFAGTPVLADPRQLATSALRAGLGAELAPLWVVIADRAPAAAPPVDAAPVLVADGDQPGWEVEYTVAPTGSGGWQRQVADDPGERAAGQVRRESSRLAGPLPAGRSLEQVLIGACLRRDLPEVRRLLGEYAGWLAGFRDEAGRLPGECVFLTPSNTVVDGSRLAALDPSWRLAGPLPYEVALARALRQFAVDMITGGYPHPWPAATDADGLTVILGGMAGMAIDRATVREAVAIEVEIVAAVRGFDREQRSAYAERLAAIDEGTPALDMDSHRKLHQSVLRLRQELEHTQAKLAWYEELLDSREQALNRAQRTIALFSGSVGYRVGRVFVGGARWVVRGMRKVARATRGRLAR
ncbi:MAG TPA: class I SAM-dependent methyltransferase [Pilimelia sp.]|nr:class I SAM-dependent methyltransferase [Pilimelia sp.]